MRVLYTNHYAMRFLQEKRQSIKNTPDPYIRRELLHDLIYRLLSDHQNPCVPTFKSLEKHQQARLLGNGKWSGISFFMSMAGDAHGIFHYDKNDVPGYLASSLANPLAK